MTRGSRQLERSRKSGGVGTVDQVEFTELWRPEDGDLHRGPERVLLERGHITEAQLQEAIEAQEADPSLTVLEALVKSEVIDQEVGLQAVAGYFKLPFTRPTSTEVDPDAIRLLPPEYLINKLVLPMSQNDEMVTVGISDPADIFLIDDLKRRLKRRIKLVVVPSKDILQVIDDLSISPEQQVDEIIKGITEDAVEVVDQPNEDVADLEKIAGESPVIRYVNYLIASAVGEGASDIHIEPGDKHLRIRYRIDGILFDQHAPPLKMHAAIVSRLKIMANLNIAERRLPQDGRIRASVHGRGVDLRVSTLPVTHGEKCVIRVLDNRAILVGLESLGMWNDTLETFRHLIFRPHGIVLVTGPTGSGKSTTLYSALRAMDGETLNISTVEDPVEYELDFANQVNVRERIGLTFSAALRSLLRQDPDIIMLGEIRDEETARIAVQASLTGHLVLSTLHTNDAPSSITRLINIGIEPFLISAAVNGILAQRLVRKICENCKTPVTKPKENVIAYIEECGGNPEEQYEGVGCDKCRHTGYKGRLGIFEIMQLDNDMRDVITSNPTLTDLRRAAKEIGMRGLREDGFQKVAAGMTTVEEIMRVTEI